MTSVVLKWGGHEPQHAGATGVEKARSKLPLELWEGTRLCPRLTLVLSPK